MNASVCAVVVTFHPGEYLEQHLLKVLQQGAGLVLVDNGSKEGERMLLRSLASRYDFHLIENPENLGIATALNIGIRWVLEKRDSHFVLLLDQDSEIESGFVNRLLSSIEDTADDRVAMAVPQILNRATRASDGPRGFSAIPHLVAQTSGTLMRLSLFQSEGWFLDELFIDYVDYEFCLRIAANGWKILFCPSAVLFHSPGQSRAHTLFGIYMGTTSNYSPIRHYYLTRNCLWVTSRYFKRYPAWCVKEVFNLIKDKAKVLIFEKESATKLKMSFLGLMDALKMKLETREFTEESVSK